MLDRLFVPAAVATLILVAAGPARAQDFTFDEGPRNSVFLELGGNAFLYSVNLERRVERWWGRVGFGYAEDAKGDVQGEIWGVPVMVGTLFGRGSHYLETGLGVVLAKHPGDEEPFVYGSLTLGYRYFSPNSGLMVRAGVAPFFDWAFSEPPGIWPALSIGWAWD